MGNRLLPSLALCLAGLAATPVLAETPPLAELAQPGRVLMLRHATAPGFGDPPEFRLGDCSTQRNLDATGRAQATALGERLRAAGLGEARVFSSAWCRCQETARLLNLGPVEPLPALNSFFQDPAAREARIRALRDFLAAQPVDGPPLILVTHQVTISAISGGGTPSGGGALFALNGTGEPTPLGAVAPP